MRGRRAHVAVAVALAFSLAGASIALAGAAGRNQSQDDQGGNLRAHLIGYQEVPALNTAGHADLKAQMTSDRITFQLDYAGLTGQPLAAHIHIGQRGVNGSVSVFFCGGGGKPPCPASASGTVTGTIVAADVIGPVAQGFNAGDLAAVEKAIRAGVAYANMHTAQFPAGEIRGQIAVSGKGNDD